MAKPAAKTLVVRTMKAPETVQITQSVRSLPGDILTPVSLYLRLRDRFPNSYLLESSDYRARDNGISYVCCDPIASFTARGKEVAIRIEAEAPVQFELSPPPAAEEALARFLKRFSVSSSSAPLPPGVINGFFGYCGYDAVQLFEDISFGSGFGELPHLAEIDFKIFRYVFALDHFRSRLHIVGNSLSGAINAADFDNVIHQALTGTFLEYPFRSAGTESAVSSDQNFLEVVEQCKSHIRRGDVFQIVPSRRFSQKFEGDDFPVYRALRSITPSPYLFYFDQGETRIFGSSPEAQIIIRGGKASVCPIAGTTQRTGNDAQDLTRVESLLDDPKENAEHAMLVDLARNDLSRTCRKVTVDTFREVQLYSHVIHLVSKVTGTLKDNSATASAIARSFPAGTLSGAPKFRAMELLDAYEGVRRQFYGGCLGFISFSGETLLAIIIRSFLSHGRSLTYQAGAGIVAASDPEKELQEVSAKLGALRAAVKTAEAQ